MSRRDPSGAAARSVTLYKAGIACPKVLLFGTKDPLDAWTQSVLNESSVYQGTRDSSIVDGVPQDDIRGFIRDNFRLPTNGNSGRIHLSGGGVIKQSGSFRNHRYIRVM